MSGPDSASSSTVDLVSPPPQQSLSGSSRPPGSDTRRPSLSKLRWSISATLGRKNRVGVEGTSNNEFVGSTDADRWHEEVTSQYAPPSTPIQDIEHDEDGIPQTDSPHSGSSSSSSSSSSSKKSSSHASSDASEDQDHDLEIQTHPREGMAPIPVPESMRGMFTPSPALPYDTTAPTSVTHSRTNIVSTASGGGASRPALSTLSNGIHRGPTPPPSRRRKSSSLSVTSSSQSQSAQQIQRLSQRRRNNRLPPLLRRIKPSLNLENSGSVARDHLASERTFLAYTRTSLAIASTGVALVQLFSLSKTGDQNALATDIQKYAPKLGAAIICLGISVLFIGIARYFSVQKALTKGHFPVARVVIVGIALGLVVLIFVVFGILVVGQNSIRR